MSKRSVFAPLAHQPFRMLFLGQLFSDLGNWLDVMTLTALIVYDWKMGAGSIALYTVTYGVPWVVIGPLASVLIDRLPRKKVMIFCVLLRVLICVGLFFVPNFPLLLLLVFGKGVLGAAFEPARQGVLNKVASEEILLEASSLSQLSVNTTKVIAPTLGGMLVVLGGARSTFLIEAVGFFLSALFLARLPQLDLPQKISGEQAKFWAEFRAGIAHIGKRRMLGSAVVIMSIGMFLVFLYDGLIALWTAHTGMNQTQYGTLISALGLGSVVGALVAGQWSSWKRYPLRMMCSTSVLSGILLATIGLGGFGYIHLFWLLWTGIFFVMGMMSAVRSVPYGFLLQTETPQEMMGRVSAAITAVQTASMLLAPGIGAWLSTYFGIGGVFLGAGALVTLVGVVFLLTVGRTSTSAGTPSSEQQGVSV